MRGLVDTKVERPGFKVMLSIARAIVPFPAYRPEWRDAL
jgi:hypothetical protein